MKLEECGIDGCTRRKSNTRVCRRHASQYPPKRVSNVCSIDGCDRLKPPGTSGPYCSMHRNRIYRTGRVDLVERDNLGYGGSHARIYAAKGAALQYACVGCGNRARDWAYDHGDTVERRDSVGTYSMDMDRYQPMCVSCHRLFDNAHRRQAVG